MKLKRYTLLFILGVLGLMNCLAQEEESAEVFLEEYTDEFQENFFEALKQKGIENYDKAINLFLECKRLDPESTVVDHELAKAYLADKNYIKAQEYAIVTVISEPESEWFLNTLVETIQRQGSTIDAIKASIPYDNAVLKENLALIYYKRQNYQEALNILNSIKKTTFSNTLALKIKDSLEQLKKPAPKAKNEIVATNQNPLENYKKQISTLIESQDYKALENRAAEALENFPSQPFFYYAHGLALNKTGRQEEALTLLETALDYLIDDNVLANKIYNELAACHSALGNTSKANMYLSKIKSGS